MKPIRPFADQACYLMLPFYGVKNKHERREAVKTGRVHSLAKVLRGLDWGKLARRMEEAQAWRAAYPDRPAERAGT